MIRIDENTYIDDTLVTCAEYQLLIDEMVGQGKYYQPDHWISYQFPTGQARTPIVGIRFSDANIFCEWLTKREAGEWSYRIPTSAEVERHPLASPVQPPLGYWIKEVDGTAQFAWVGSIPVSPREIASALMKARDIDLDLAPDRLLARARAFARASLLERALDLAIYYGRTLDLDHTYELDLDLDRDLDRNLDHDRTRHRYLDRTRILALALYIDSNRARDFDRAIDLYLDILTLQERIAGRSPAFEGLRLVKERKS